ncbi:MAG: hypothetical protein ICV87_05540 [Gemmatimonadetes bacterium]|nr:hypothetical protein [Gemmatimonadota bacterium]
MPEIQPPHPSDKFTLEEAMAALERVEAEQKARRKARRQRAKQAPPKRTRGRADESAGGDP